MDKKEYKQFTNRVIAIQPKPFYSNLEAKLDNKFMHDTDLSREDIYEESMQEFKTFINVLTEGGVEVIKFEQQNPDAPDSVFPDWFTTHRNADIPDGLLVLYPMRHKSRRLERDQEIINTLRKEFKHFIDLTYLEEKSLALEGKGALVFDYRNKKIYCSLSPRANIEALDILVEEYNKLSRSQYKSVSFKSHDRHDNVVYHTDCMMTLLHDHAVICLDAIKNDHEKQMVREELSSEEKNPHGAYEIFELTNDEMEGMCANMFNLVDLGGNNTVIMSARASRTYQTNKLQSLKAHYKVLIANVDMLEYIAGGSTRCMLAEMF